ncbi:unnamed protein product, partial [Amoebophrya sp. A25]
QQVGGRLQDYKGVCLALFDKLVETSSQVLTDEQLEEIVGKCPLDEKTDEEFNQMLDICLEEYTRAREESRSNWVARKKAQLEKQQADAASDPQRANAAVTSASILLELDKAVDEEIWQPRRLFLRQCVEDLRKVLV